MFVRLVRFSLMDGKQSVAKDLSKDLIPDIGRQPGCKSVISFGDDSSSEYGLFVLWESEEAANAAQATMYPRLQQHLAGNVKQPADRRLFQVIASAP